MVRQLTRRSASEMAYETEKNYIVLYRQAIFGKIESIKYPKPKKCARSYAVVDFFSNAKYFFTKWKKNMFFKRKQTFLQNGKLHAIALVQLPVCFSG